MSFFFFFVLFFFQTYNRRRIIYFCLFATNFLTPPPSPVWADSCRSWYKGNTITGKVVGLWPGSTLHYLEAIKEPRWEDWILEREAGTNRFGYLGDGHSTIETQGLDYAYYLRNHDDSPVDPVLKKPKRTQQPDGAAVDESDRARSGFLPNGGAEDGVNGGVAVAVA